MADPGRHADRRGRHVAGHPVDAARGQRRAPEFAARADHHLLRRGVELEHVERNRRRHAEALPLADRITMQAAVPADRPSARIDDVAGGRRVAELAFDECPRVAVGHEADLVTVGLVRDEQSPPRRIGAHVGLRHVADRKQRVGELVLRQREEK